MNQTDQRTLDPHMHGRPGRGPLVAGIILILIGLYFLLERFELLPPINTSWPVIIMLVGVALIIGYVATFRRR
jgi:uncharacterized membrane protein HdeD (DUF308 family)